jgi:hypothetical protein
MRTVGVGDVGRLSHARHHRGIGAVVDAIGGGVTGADLTCGVDQRGVIGIAAVSAGWWVYSAVWKCRNVSMDWSATQ